MPADTFRAWERRYGLPHPARTAGNQRLYSDRDIATIVWLRDQTRSGLTISQAVQLFHTVDRQESGSSGKGPDDVAMDAPMHRFATPVVEALVNFDAQAADRVVEEAMAFMPVEDVCLQVLQPALYEIGRRWARGEVTVSTEHFASAFVVRKLGALFNLSQVEAGRGPVIAACLEGELHEVGLLLTCLFLSRRGIKILYLGPNMPLDDLMKTVHRFRAPLVLLSASTPEAAEQLADASRRIHSEGGDPLHPSSGGPIVGFGGRIFVERPDLRDRVAGVFLGDNADAAAHAVDDVLRDGFAAVPRLERG